jgi:hypothetical protein
MSLITFEVGGMVPAVARRRMKFDGFELRCHGVGFLVERYATEAEARERAAEVVKGWAPETLADVRARQATADHA